MALPIWRAFHGYLRGVERVRVNISFTGNELQGCRLPLDESGCPLTSLVSLNVGFPTDAPINASNEGKSAV
jgi:hypothetical protein